MGSPEALQRLEAIVHPLVTAYKRAWLAQQAAAGQQLVVLDIPLLYETGAETGCDAVGVVSAPAEAQRQRALARPGMSEAKLEAILARQVPDAEKRRRADFVIDTVRAQSVAWRGVPGWARLSLPVCSVSPAVPLFHALVSSAAQTHVQTAAQSTTVQPRTCCILLTACAERPNWFGCLSAAVCALLHCAVPSCREYR